MKTQNELTLDEIYRAELGDSRKLSKDPDLRYDEVFAILQEASQHFDFDMECISLEKVYTVRQLTSFILYNEEDFDKDDF